jgi:hypothetical protein
LNPRYAARDLAALPTRSELALDDGDRLVGRGDPRRHYPAWPAPSTFASKRRFIG